MADEPMEPTHQAAIDEIQKILAALPDDEACKIVLSALLTHRCRKCLDYDESGSFWCCYDSRGR